MKPTFDLHHNEHPRHQKINCLDLIQTSVFIHSSVVPSVSHQLQIILAAVFNQTKTRVPDLIPPQNQRVYSSAARQKGLIPLFSVCVCVCVCVCV